MGDKKTTTDSTQTTTPNVPQWGVDSLQNLNTSIDGLAQTDPQSYVPDASPLQLQAQTGAGALGGWKAPAADARSAIDSLSDPAALAKYMSPYTGSVVDTTLAGYDHNAAQVRAQQEAQGAAAGAFGGSRFGVQQGTFDADTALGRAQQEAALRDAAFKTGSANALAAGSALTGLSSDMAGNDRADIGLQDQLGQEQRNITQAKATAPITQAQVIAALLQQNQFGLLTGETGTGHSTQTVSDPMGMISGILGGVGSAASGAAAFNKSGGLAGMFG